MPSIALLYIDVCDGGITQAAPAAPSGLNASNSYSGSGRKKIFNGVNLTWTNNAGNADHNLIERCDKVAVSGPKRQKIYTCSSESDWKVLSSSVAPIETKYFDGSTATNSMYLLSHKGCQ